MSLTPADYYAEGRAAYAAGVEWGEANRRCPRQPGDVDNWRIDAWRAGWWAARTEDRKIGPPP